MLLWGKQPRRKRGRASARSGSALISLLLVLVILLAMMPAGALVISAAAEDGYLCGHVHDEACGYTEASEGSPCTHVHDEVCGYVEGSPCTDTHEHNAECGYVEGAACTYFHEHGESCGYAVGAPCTYVHVHNESCGYDAATGTGCTDVHSHDASCGYIAAAACTDIHTHDAACGYIEAVPCGYTHTHDESCGYVEAVACTHVHDESCGYAEPVEGTPCTHVCGILGFTDYTPGKLFGVRSFVAGTSYDSICASLPKTLGGSLACSAAEVNIPVRWSCAEFTGAAGAYIFRAVLDNEHCYWTASDDPYTTDIDESLLPFIEVTVTEPEPTPEPTTEPTTEPTPEPTTEPTPESEAEPALFCLAVSDYPVTVSGEGTLPEGAYLSVTEVPVELAQELLGEPETVILFAYDIKILIPSETEGGAPTEYQPGAEHPVTVTIFPPEPIADAVEIIHIPDDALPQLVSEVTATAEGALEFSADGFSVYVVKLGAETPRVSFCFDDNTLNVSYSTDGVTYNPLTAGVLAAAVTQVYFKVTDGTVEGAYRDGTELVASAGVYTVDGIDGNTTITLGSLVPLDVTYGSIVIGEADGVGGRRYTHYNSGGTQQTGVHTAWNIYKVTGSTGSSAAGGFNVSLTGAGDFNVVLSNVTIYTGSTGAGICAPVSTSGVDSGNICITLEGANTLENLSTNASSSFAALEKMYSGSVLIIGGSGSLRAIGGADSAGIGGSDGATSNIVINGGTIYASSTGSQGAGIGSGNNSVAENISIYGGNITAVGMVNGAGIGGAGSVSFLAAMGQVSIYGGTITATSNGSGAGIGGGGSGQGAQSLGGVGQVSIYGGSITADSIGGGDGDGQSGGGAVVRVYGGRILVTGSRGISGGDSASGTGGNVTVTVTGGTVVTPRISGGYSGSAGSYNDATLSIAAATVSIADRTNIHSVTGPDPDGGAAEVVYCQTISLSALEGYSGDVAGIRIESAGLTDEHTYPLNDVYSDAEGILYFWLPTIYDVETMAIGGQTYNVTAGAQVQVATITHDSSTVGSVFGAVLNYGTPTNYTWQISADGSAWADIAGAVGSDKNSYTVVAGDVGKLIRVVISTADGDVTSGSLRIAPVPVAWIYAPSLRHGSTLYARLDNGNATSYQWQRLDTDADPDTWVDIAGATSSYYSTGGDSLGQSFRVIVGYGRLSFDSEPVVMAIPTYTITIPESIPASGTAGSFAIMGERNDFTAYQGVYVACSFDSTLSLVGAPSITLDYDLFTTPQRTTPLTSGGRLASFIGGGTSVINVYYTINGAPLYSGAYTDIITFSVSTQYL